MIKDLEEKRTHTNTHTHAHSSLLTVRTQMSTLRDVSEASVSRRAIRSFPMKRENKAVRSLCQDL